MIDVTQSNNSQSKDLPLQSFLQFINHHWIQFKGYHGLYGSTRCSTCI